MSTTMHRETPPRDRGTVDHRLARLLDAPSFARVVPHLAPETLHRLIHHRGLEACGELVASASPAQLTSLLDFDLWRREAPGRDEGFDAERFGEWLDVLVDTDASMAARIVAALDRPLVVAGLSRYLRLFDPGTFEPTESSDDEAMDRHEMMDSERDAWVLECEVGGYLVRARRADAWDAIVTLLVTLEIEHNLDFHAIMRGCRGLSHSRPEVDGLDDLLSAPDQHLHDVAIARERRRSRQGYATAADARAFLQLARQPHYSSPTPPSSMRAPRSTTGTPSAPGASSPPAPFPIHPIAAAYFRAADGDEDQDLSPDNASAGVSDAATAPGARDAGAHGGDGLPMSMDAILELLAEAGVMPERPRGLLGAGGGDPHTAKLPLLGRLMTHVLHRDQAAYFSRSRELAFLANTLLAGASVQSRPFTPQEASDAAASICNLGLECWPARWPGARSHRTAPSGPPDAATFHDEFLVEHDLVTTFEVGWSVLYQDVSLFAADRLIATVADLYGVDAGTRSSLRALRRALEKQREAGTPWLARGAADVLATLDTTVWISVLGLLDECPILPAALTAVVERRTTPVSPTAFDFISTTAQIGDVRVFMRALPGILSR